jgi:hypothetical protein
VLLLLLLLLLLAAATLLARRCRLVDGLRRERDLVRVEFSQHLLHLRVRPLARHADLRVQLRRRAAYTRALAATCPPPRHLVGHAQLLQLVQCGLYEAHRSLVHLAELVAFGAPRLEGLDAVAQCAQLLAQPLVAGALPRLDEQHVGQLLAQTPLLREVVRHHRERRLEQPRVVVPGWMMNSNKFKVEEWGWQRVGSSP